MTRPSPTSWIELENPGQDSRELIHKALGIPRQMIELTCALEHPSRIDKGRPCGDARLKQRCTPRNSQRASADLHAEPRVNDVVRGDSAETIRGAFERAGFFEAMRRMGRIRRMRPIRAGGRPAAVAILGEHGGEPAFPERLEDRSGQPAVHGTYGPRLRDEPLFESALCVRSSPPALENELEGRRQCHGYVVPMEHRAAARRTHHPRYERWVEQVALGVLPHSQAHPRPIPTIHAVAWLAFVLRRLQ